MQPMDQQGCANPMSAVFAFFAAFFLLAGFGGNAGPLFFFIFLMLPLWLAGQQRRAAAQAAYRAQRYDYVQPPVPEVRDRAWLERQILRVAARHGGTVTPAQITMAVEGIDLATARAALDALAEEGHAVLDSDDAGRPIYAFAVGERQTDSRDVSPEEWVRQHSPGQSRLRGEADDERTVSLDD